MNTSLLKSVSSAILISACLAAGTADAFKPIPPGRAFGFIDRNGDIVVPPACDLADFPQPGDWARLRRDLKEGFANLKTRQSTGLIFEAGDFLHSGAPLFSRGPEPAKKDGKYGYVDQKGKTVIPFRYDGAGQFGEDGLAVVGLNGKFGYIDRRGEFAVQPRFARALPFGPNGLAVVRDGDLWGAIDRHGDFVIPAKFEELRLSRYSDLVVARLNGKAGVLDSKGNKVVPFKFDAIGDFGANGLAAASADVRPGPSGSAASVGHSGFIDRAGEFVIPPIYSQVSAFEDEQYRKDVPWDAFRAPLGLARAIPFDSSGVGTTSYIDAQGKTIIALPPGIEGERVFRNGLISVIDLRKPNDLSARHGRGLFDPANPVLPKIWYDTVSDPGEGDLIPVALANGWGYVDRAGAFVILPQFERADAFKADGLAVVAVKDTSAVYHRRNGTFIDRTGKVRLQTQFDDVVPYTAAGFIEVIVVRPRSTDSIALSAEQCAVRR